MNADPISKLHKWTRDIMVGWLAGDTNDDNYGQPQPFEYFVCQTGSTPSPLLKGMWFDCIPSFFISMLATLLSMGQMDITPVLYSFYSWRYRDFQFRINHIFWFQVDFPSQK